MENKEMYNVINVKVNNKFYTYKDLNEFLISNCLSMLEMTSLIADLKLYLKQDEQIAGLNTHLSDNAHTDIYNMVIDLLKHTAKLNLDVNDKLPIDIASIIKVGDCSVSFPKFDKLLSLHKYAVGGTYVDIPNLFDFELVYNVDTTSKLINDIIEYETTNSKNAPYMKSKPIIDENTIRTTIYPLYNYLFATEKFFKS